VADPPPASVLEQEDVFAGRVFKLRRELVVLPNGKQARLDLIRHPGAAAVVPLDADGNVLLVRQYRHATGKWLLEVPAGTLAHGEPPESCALRELMEEAGYRASELQPLGWIWTTPGFTDERIWLYLAKGLEPAPRQLDDDEVMTVERLAFSEAVRRAQSGEIEDAKSVCALLRAAAWLATSGPRG
jgi:ADP-ribose pyrophosphatase